MRLRSGGVHLGEGDVDDLRFGVEVDAVRAALAAHARSLDAAERRAQVADVVGVDPDHAGCDGVRDAVAALEVRGPDVRGQTELRGVREVHGLGLVVEGSDGHDRAEDLLLEDTGVTLDVGEDGGLEVVAVGEVVGAAATGDQTALLPADLHVVQDALVVFGVYQCADLGGRVGREPDAYVGGALRQSPGELLVQRALDENA